MTLSAPDWAAIDETIRCPLCTYNLRGLSQPRCPECGYRFEWVEVLDPTKRLHPYLFEHHPERNVDAYFRTLVNGFRPRAFWTSLHPVQPSFPRRIILYWLVGVPLLIAAGMVCPLTQAHVVATDNALARTAFEANPQRFLANALTRKMFAEHGSMQQYFEAEMPTGMFGVLRRSVTESPTFLVVASLPYVIPLAWPWVTFVSLLVFLQSMKRAKVDRSHVLRCVVYSFDVAIWIGLAYLAIILLYLLGVLTPRLVTWRGVEAVYRMHCWIAVPFLLFAWLRMWIAYRMYLRFPHAVAVIGATALIVVLATAAFVGFLVFGW